MKTISLKLPVGLHASLDRAAKQRKQSKSDVVRAALELFLNGEGAIPPGSLLEASKPWIGCVAGPGDLSTNPKYMADFGTRGREFQS
ncbi:MAG TPA: ribbon-helix-helix protein, CopG family [Pirellulales bacterium]|nr:ribbon-helix-helix protein, CopG family [Pirellulales bacterium]